MFVIMLKGPDRCGKTRVLTLVEKSLESTGGTVIKKTPIPDAAAKRGRRSHQATGWRRLREPLFE